jgi:hypothetical protein
MDSVNLSPIIVSSEAADATSANARMGFLEKPGGILHAHSSSQKEKHNL